MLKYFKKLDKNSFSVNVSLDDTGQAKIHKTTMDSTSSQNSKEQARIIDEKSDLSELPSDPEK